MSYLYEELRNAIDLNPDYIKQLNYRLEDTFLTSFLIAASQGFKSDDPETAAGFAKVKAEGADKDMHVIIAMFMLGFGNSAHAKDTPSDRYMQSMCRILGSAFNNSHSFDFDVSFIEMVTVNINATGDVACDMIRDNIPMTDAQKASIQAFSEMFREMAQTEDARYSAVKQLVRNKLNEVYSDMLGPRPNPNTAN